MAGCCPGNLPGTRDVVAGIRSPSTPKCNIVGFSKIYNSHHFRDDGSNNLGTTWSYYFSLKKRLKVFMAKSGKYSWTFFLKYIFSQALLPSIVQIAFLLNSRRISIVCLIPNLYY